MRANAGLDGLQCVGQCQRVIGQDAATVVGTEFSATTDGHADHRRRDRPEHSDEQHRGAVGITFLRVRAAENHPVLSHVCQEHDGGGKSCRDAVDEDVPVVDMPKFVAQNGA